ncbi:hypothetical protein MtrunA17_Chr1g0196671 [Medicago truncatula]|uniref:Uncharacterized protein n=1 Tax=Medicago truncatula TaxID=3880 RepID=A0A396JYQ1_MEDTR|nr:hypothetical protein MtrunA17_Chr1g0196671 [Medicago truncatula]
MNSHNALHYYAPMGLPLITQKITLKMMLRSNRGTQMDTGLNVLEWLTRPNNSMGHGWITIYKRTGVGLG